MALQLKSFTGRSKDTFTGIGRKFVGWTAVVVMVATGGGTDKVVVEGTTVENDCTQRNILSLWHSIGHPWGIFSVSSIPLVLCHRMLCRGKGASVPIPTPSVNKRRNIDTNMAELGKSSATE